MREDGLMPCKRHNVLPTLRTIDMTENIWPTIKKFRQEYYCHLCEQDEKGKQLQVLIDDWNKKQEE